MVSKHVIKWLLKSVGLAVLKIKHLSISLFFKIWTKMSRILENPICFSVHFHKELPYILEEKFVVLFTFWHLYFWKPICSYHGSLDLRISPTVINVIFVFLMLLLCYNCAMSYQHNTECRAAKGHLSSWWIYCSV